MEKNVESSSLQFNLNPEFLYIVVQFKMLSKDRNRNRPWDRFCPILLILGLDRIHETE